MSKAMLKICDALDNNLRPTIAKLVATKDFSFEVFLKVESTETELKHAYAALCGIDCLIIELQDNFDDVYETAGDLLGAAREQDEQQIR